MKTWSIAFGVEQRIGASTASCRLEFILLRLKLSTSLRSSIAAERFSATSHLLACTATATRAPNLSGLDRRRSGRKLVPLFNPRRHSWNRHFRWDGIYLKGRTAIGRVTVEVLAMNEPLRLAVRSALMEDGLFFRTR
jgi:hypothetical protein